MDARTAVESYLDRVRSVMADLDSEAAARIADMAAETVTRGCKILICGNGGSAADASHLAGELVGRFRMERVPFPAVALTTDPAVLTALGNDYGYECVFSRQVEALGDAGDLLMAVTTSGTSPNVVNAAKSARKRGMTVVAFTSSACEEAPWADVHWRASCPETSHAQEQMFAVFHSICHGMEAMIESRN